MDGRYVRRTQIACEDPRVAVERLAEDLRQDALAGVVFFCSADYDPDLLAAQIRERFDCPVVGCTTAGEIGSTYQSGGIVGLSFSSEKFRFHPIAIESLRSFHIERASEISASLLRTLEFAPGFDPQSMFGLLLIDGLSAREEQVTGFLHAALQGVEIIGGSAGDSLQFVETRVFLNGRFKTDAAVFILIESKLPFSTFKLQHFEPSEKDMVITAADPSTRTVFEIDGGPAAREYADILGLDIDTLSPEVFSRHPLMLQIGAEWYVRSIQKVNPDGSLTFYCAIDEGLPLTVANGICFVETLEARVRELKRRFSRIECTLGCDCILRRLELMESGHQKQVESLLRELNFAGFSTFGEQYNGIHINQTLTGVVIGEQ